MNRTLAAGTLALAATFAFHASSPGAEAENYLRRVGRVGVRPSHPEVGCTHKLLREAVSEAVTMPRETGPSPERMLSFRADVADSQRFHGAVYNYDEEQGYAVDWNEVGDEVSRTPLDSAPRANRAEYQEAAKVVSADARFRPGLADDSLRLFRPNPNFAYSDKGERMVLVGVTPTDAEARAREPFTIVSVTLKTAEVAVRERAEASDAAGDLPLPDASMPLAGDASFEVQWPVDAPVWKFTATRPMFGRHGDASGLWISDASLKDRSAFAEAGIWADAAGVEDWFLSESRFQTDGNPLCAGLKVCQSMPTTLVDNGTDEGDFNGIAIYDAGDSLYLVTECDCGPVRYTLQWRFGLDGSFEPSLGAACTAGASAPAPAGVTARWGVQFAPDAQMNSVPIKIATSRLSPETGRWLAQEKPVSRPGMYRVRNAATGFGFAMKATAGAVAERSARMSQSGPFADPAGRLVGEFDLPADGRLSHGSTFVAIGAGESQGAK